MFQRILTSSFIFLIAVGGFLVNIHTEHGVHGTKMIASMEINTVAAGTGSTMQTGTTGTSPTSNTTKNTPKTESEWLDGAIMFLNAILGGITLIITPAIILAGWLLSPDFTSGDLFGLRPVMHNLWITVSNIVYFIYAILLIIIALAAILGKEDKFSYRVMLPKLALGMILVPFTWWFVQWTISLATVVTTSVVSIPLNVVDQSKNTYFDGNYIPKNYLIDNSGSGKTTPPNTEQCTGGTEGDNANCTSIRKIIDTGGGAYASMLLYSYDVFKFNKVKEMSSELNAITNAGQLLNQLVIGALMFLVFGILVLALIFVLLMRTIKLWMYAIFSPLFTLHFVAGKELFSGDSDNHFDIGQFIGLAFVPAIVGLILSFGLVIVSAVRQPVESSTNKCSTGIEITIDNNGKYERGGCEVLGLFGNPENKIIMGIGAPENDKKTYSYNVIKIAGMTMVFKGQATNGANVLKGANKLSSGLDVMGGIFGTIIVDIIALVFIWMAFMSVGAINKGVKKTLEPFEQLGKTIGDGVSALPKYTPLPIPGGSLAGAQKAAQGITSIPEYKANKRFEGSDLGQFIKRNTGQADSTEVIKSMDMVKSSKNLQEVTENMRQYSADQMRDQVIPALIKDSSARDAVSRKLSSSEKDLFDTLSKKKLEELTVDEKYKLGLLLKGEKTINITGSTAILKQKLDQDIVKKDVDNTTGTPPEASNININVNQGMDAAGAVTAIKSNANNGTITEGDLKAKLEEAYKTATNKDTIIKDIIDALKKNDSGFTFKK